MKFGTSKVFKDVVLTDFFFIQCMQQDILSRDLPKNVMLVGLSSTQYIFHQFCYIGLFKRSWPVTECKTNTKHAQSHSFTIMNTADESYFLLPSILSLSLPLLLSYGFSIKHQFSPTPSLCFIFPGKPFWPTVHPEKRGRNKVLIKHL